MFGCKRLAYKTGFTLYSFELKNKWKSDGLYYIRLKYYTTKKS
jgi:hypothetical protein